MPIAYTEFFKDIVLILTIICIVSKIILSSIISANVLKLSVNFTRNFCDTVVRNCEVERKMKQVFFINILQVRNITLIREYLYLATSLSRGQSERWMRCMTLNAPYPH